MKLDPSTRGPKKDLSLKRGVGGGGVKEGGSIRR